MRKVVLFLLPAAVAVFAACGTGETEGREEATASVPERDLTMAAAPSETVVAGPVELRQTRTPPRITRPSRRAERPSIPVEAKPVPVVLTVTTVPVAVSDSAAFSPSPASDRELPPGKTVTIIPASTGNSSPSEWDEDFPTVRGTTMGGRIGGRCPPRGPKPGIGIATRPRPSFY
jgi:hypothetical protein